MASTTYDPKEKHKAEDHLGKAKQAGEDALQKAKEAGKDILDQAKQAGNAALQEAKDASSDVLGKAKDAASAVGEMASHAACAVGQKADDLTAAAGHEIKTFGDTIAKKAPHEGITGAASQAVAETVKGGGRYIEDAKLSGMAHDVEQVIKNHPIPALLACLGIGFCLGRMMKD